LVTKALLSLLAFTLAPLGQSAQAQAGGAATVDQIPSRSAVPRDVRPGTAAPDIVRVAPVRGKGSSSSVQEAEGQKVPPRVSPEVVEACRAAQAEDRPPPEGVDCLAAIQASAEAEQNAATAESSLLQLFGQSGDVTGARNQRSGASVNADAVARQLSTGEVQPSSGGTAAGVIARERGAPSNPPR
jgi:hypothetical protein